MAYRFSILIIWLISENIIRPDCKTFGKAFHGIELIINVHVDARGLLILMSSTTPCTLRKLFYYEIRMSLSHLMLFVKQHHLCVVWIPCSLKYTSKSHSRWDFKMLIGEMPWIHRCMRRYLLLRHGDCSAAFCYERFYVDINVANQGISAFSSLHCYILCWIEVDVSHITQCYSTCTGAVIRLPL